MIVKYNRDEYLCSDFDLQQAVVDELLDENIQLLDTLSRIKDIVYGDYDFLDPLGLQEIRRLINKLEEDDV